jgi:hypothetical protein
LGDNDFRAAVGGVVSTKSLENTAQTKGGLEAIIRDSAGSVDKQNIRISKVYIFKVPRVLYKIAGGKASSFKKTRQNRIRNFRGRW